MRCRRRAFRFEFNTIRRSSLRSVRMAVCLSAFIKQKAEETTLKITLNICRVVLASVASVGCGLAFANQPVPSDSISMTSDAASALQAADQVSEQDKAKGFIGGSHLNLLV